jgi:hypothetical protein
MDDDSRALDNGWDALPGYNDGAGDAEEAVTVSISTAPGEWLVNTSESVVVPMSMVEVVEALRAGKLTDRSLVWRNGMQEWLQVDRVPQLKLAARLPATPSRPAPRLSPPPKPSKSQRSSTAPQGTPRPSLSPEASSSPRASRPITSRPTAPPPSSASLARPAPPSRPSASRAALPPPPSADEGAIAIYDRPAATISFAELEPEAPLPTQRPVASAAPETLAPTTTDTAPRRAPASHPADLSVVAASQFRAQQRTSHRLIWISSLGSAAAASLLTLWISSSPSPASGAAAVAPAPSELSASPAPPPIVPSVVAPPAPKLAAEAPAPPEPAPKPKAKRKARAWHPPRVAPVAAPKPAPAAEQDPSTDANPYDIKLAEDPPATPTPATEASPSDTADGRAEGSSASRSDAPSL